MKIQLAVIGRLKESYLIEAEAEYVKRLRPYCTFEAREYADEAELLKKLPADAHVYAFDERGELLSSTELARDVIAREEQHGGGALVVLAIGGADGHTDALRARAKKLLAFGRLTIAHRLVRILVIEQLYRAYKIVRGEPYHRE